MAYEKMEWTFSFQQSQWNQVELFLKFWKTDDLRESKVSSYLYRWARADSLAQLR